MSDQTANKQWTKRRMLVTTHGDILSSTGVRDGNPTMGAFSKSGHGKDGKTRQPEALLMVWTDKPGSSC
jgi:hypothetical protein